MTPKSELTSLEQNTWYSPEYQKIGFYNLSYDTNELTFSFDFMATVEANLTDYLKSLGYEVEPSDTFEGMRVKALSISGGFFDPVTGELNTKKRDAFNRTILTDYTGKNDVDLMLSLHFFKSRGVFTDSKVEWNNMQDVTTYPPTLLFELAKGTMPTISVKITVLDPATGLYKSRIQGVQVNLGFHSTFDIHPEDMPRHLKNLRLGLQQLQQP